MNGFPPLDFSGLLCHQDLAAAAAVVVLVVLCGGVECDSCEVSWLTEGLRLCEGLWQQL